ncbi:histidine kinase [Jeotgalibacillus alimentarius]|uniref:Heme sensor protein HssS n=1 Tax=Jeotgalibacillus alimentarius TaxID=135826 RepID=A0A0C2VE14_9BACL|nr:HAMP domain-containing sensor histidine kinase [Jeotgalibacillus alimentarius]KIL42796.1 histidine kinase [Jeotgalibacillus alimentarius]
MNLYVKFIWFTFTTMLLSSLIGFLVMNVYYDLNLKDANNDKNMRILIEVAEQLESGSGQPAETLNLLGDAGYQFYLTGNGRSEFYGGEYREQSLSDDVISSVLNDEQYHGISEFPRSAFITGFFANELRNTVGVPVTIEGADYALFMRPDIGLLFQELHWLFAGLAGGIILLSFLLMMIVARLLTRPIVQLTEAAEQMERESFDQPLKVKRRDEIGRLAERFTAMRTQIARSIQKREEFVHNVSHDIQSPLHKIQSTLSLLEKETLTESERQHYYGMIRGEAAQISSLTKQLLILASFNEEESLSEQVEVSTQLTAIIERLRYLFDENGLAVAADLEHATVRGNGVLLQSVWENLLTNAIKYSHGGGLVEVICRAEKDHVEVIIKDEGIGMTEAQVAQAFDRFYRADEARSEQGSGLGLSIVKEIIDLHSGTVRIESETSQGTTVKVRL